MSILYFKDVVIGDIVEADGVYWRKVSDDEMVEIAEPDAKGRIGDDSFSEGHPGEVIQGGFDDDDEFETVPDDKKRELLAAHKMFLEDLANLFGVIL